MRREPDRVEAVVVALTISTGHDEGRHGPSLGIDMYFLNKADKKRIVEIDPRLAARPPLRFSEDLQEKFLAAAVGKAWTWSRTQPHARRRSSGDAAKLDAITARTPRLGEVRAHSAGPQSPHGDAAEQSSRARSRRS